MNSSIIGYNPLSLILVGIIYPFIVLVCIPVTMHFLLKRCNQQYEDFEVYTEETDRLYIPIHKLLIKLFTKPKALITTGQITAYNQDDLEVCYYSISILLGLIVTGLIYGAKVMLVGIVAIPIAVAIGRWFYVGIHTLFFRYIARVKLSYEEGQRVFRPMYLMQCIITTILEYIQSLVPEKWRYISFTDSFKISIFQIIIIIWFTIISFLLLKHRYHLSGKQSVIKIILMYLSYLGIIITLVFVLGLIGVLTQ